ncbi:MAG: nuclease-related domain-containing protein [Kiritimatiellales bacterium]
MNTEKPLERFAKTYGIPGQSPRTLGPLRVFWPLAPFCFVAGWLLHAALPYPYLSTSQAGILFILLAAALALFSFWSAHRLRSFIKGAEGEETVARTLAVLPANCTVFNDLQFDDGTSFDHIVVSPSGVFVIETKNWSGEITFQNGQVLCNGRMPSRPPIKQVKEAAAALEEYLVSANCAAPVRAVICFVGNQLHGGFDNIGGVRICNENNLLSLFENPLEEPLPAGTLGMISGELARIAEK